MIYYVSLDNPNPSGGVKTQYRHVEILNAAGKPAAMLHQNKPFTAATWFDSTAPVKWNDDGVEVSPGDCIVWPEIMRASIYPMDGVKQIIFNQNIHYSWRGFHTFASKYETNVDGTMVLTEWERDRLGFFVPDHPVGVVRHGIDPNVWAYDGRTKKRQIAFMPRKHGDEAQAVFGWLYQTGALDGWKIVAVDNKTERESAEILKDSAVFFAFGYPEGGTLPPFEAAMAGCQVVGYGGFASDDLMFQVGARVIPSGDTCQFSTVATLLLPGYGSFVPELSRDTAIRLFPLERERDSLIRFMERMKV